MERLGQDVSNRVAGSAMDKRDGTISDLFADPVVVDFNVLGPAVKNGVFGQVYRAQVVTV